MATKLSKQAAQARKLEKKAIEVRLTPAQVRAHLYLLRRLNRIVDQAPIVFEEQPAVSIEVIKVALQMLDRLPDKFSVEL